MSRAVQEGTGLIYRAGTGTGGRGPVSQSVTQNALKAVVFSKDWSCDGWATA
jgi:hypothetical protein